MSIEMGTLFNRHSKVALSSPLCWLLKYFLFLKPWPNRVRGPNHHTHCIEDDGVENAKPKEEGPEKRHRAWYYGRDVIEFHICLKIVGHIKDLKQLSPASSRQSEQRLWRINGYVIVGL